MSAIDDIIANGGASLTGNVAKAKLRIKESKAWKDAELKLREGTKPGGNAAGFGGAGVDTSALDALDNAASSIGMDIADMGIDAAGASKIIDELIDGIDGYNKEFTVQFNPSSLQIRGFGGGDVSQLMQDFAGGDANHLKRMGLSMILSVKLLFDSMELGSAFPLSTNQVTLSSAMNAVYDKAKQSITGTAPTPVQTVVEGIIGALRSSHTRQICFEWGDMFYEGLLREVSGQYTLFDAVGRPIRAEINLSIYLRDPNIQEKDGTLNLGYWQQAYEKAFSTSTSYVSGLQKFLRNFGGA